jgi:1-deoxy-D-xylulose-5-phosphate reductoisomerase
VGRFPALELGYRAAREGGTAGAVLSAANEVLVRAFLEGRCGFDDIARLAARVMDLREEVRSPSLGDIWEADELARAAARGALEELTGSA